MSRHIDLMPESCRTAFGRRAFIRRWAVAYAGVGVLVVGAYFAASADHDVLREKRGRLADKVREAWNRNDEAQRLVNDIRNVESTITRYNRLAWPVRMTDTVTEITALVPESLTLTSMTLTPRRETFRVPGAHGRGKTDVRMYLAIELEGVSPNDQSMMPLLEGLERHVLFVEVKLDYSRERLVDGVEARGFRVTCEIDLQKSYEFVDASTDPASQVLDAGGTR